MVFEAGPINLEATPMRSATRIQSRCLRYGQTACFTCRSIVGDIGDEVGDSSSIALPGFTVLEPIRVSYTLLTPIVERRPGIEPGL